ncbi:hypothetical protein Tco_0973604 [Tanacetum coccineum]
MPVIRFHCPFVGLSGCHDGSGNMLTKTLMFTHLGDRHCKGDAQAITKQSLATNLAVFDKVEVTFKRMGLCCVRFILYGFTKPSTPSSSDPLDHVDVLGKDVYGGFTLTLLDRLLSKGLRTVKSIPPKCRLGSSRVLKGALNKVICTPDDISYWLLRETLAEPALSLSDILEEDLESSDQNIKQCKRKICDGHYTAAVRVLSSSGIASYTDATLDDLKAKHPGNGYCTKRQK